MIAPREDPPSYRCTVCDADWSYEAVRYVGRCRACGGALVRNDVLVTGLAVCLKSGAVGTTGPERRDT